MAVDRSTEKTASKNGEKTAYISQRADFLLVAIAVGAVSLASAAVILP